MKKAKAAKSADEILALAKENGIEITSEEARETFELLSKTGEISDEELDNVSGGGCSVSVEGRKCKVVTSGLKCINGNYVSNYEKTSEWYNPVPRYRVIYTNDHKALRSTWFQFSRKGTCGCCRWLGFKGATGYCSKS